MSVSYNNNFTNVKMNLTDKDILEIETKYRFKFPIDIREHYLTYNGGEPERYVFVDDDGNEYIVQKFFPIKYKNHMGGGNLESTLDRLREDDKILPDWLMPFAVDLGGTLYCFSSREDELGSIYFWDHEYEYGEDSGEHISYLAESLLTFIESMIEDQ